MKKLTLFILFLAALLTFSCSKDSHDGKNIDPSTDVAYVSLNIYNQATRSEEEVPDPKENALKSICLITFDAAGVVTKVPGTSLHYAEQATNTTSPPPFKVSGSSAKLLVIANPGPALKNFMNNEISSTSTIASIISNAIEAIKIDELIDNTANTKGFAMINSGNDALPATDITDPTVDLAGYIEKVSDHNGREADAIDAADLNRVHVKIERLASRVDFSVKSTVQVKPVGDATFNLIKWNLDAVNSTYYPYAVKKLLRNNHTAGDYTTSFYTTDPNYSGMTIGQGLHIATVTNYEPVFPDNYYQGWFDDGDKVYCVENTMAAEEQKYGNATRVVLKATYYYDQAVTGDWFNFAGINYPSLTALQTAYTAAGGTGNLAAACDKMFLSIQNYYATVLSESLTATKFSELTEPQLAKINNGGEVLKDGKNDVIRWYQNGLCYYYYEIRHNREATAEMEYAKYGVVRNHLYQLNLATVHGAGTPWYPDINEPGPGDPDPTDPIDEESAYLGVELVVMPWILWKYDIDV